MAEEDKRRRLFAVDTPCRVRGSEIGGNQTKFIMYAETGHVDVDQSTWDMSACGITQLTRSSSLKNSFRRSKREPHWITSKKPFITLFLDFLSPGFLLSELADGSDLTYPLRQSQICVLVMCVW